MDEDESYNTSSRISPVWGLVLGLVAILIAIVAIILPFVLPSKNNNTNIVSGSIGTITNYTPAVYMNPTTSDSNSVWYTYNKNQYNTVIPNVNNANKVIVFYIDANNVDIGDSFTIDNTNNPKNQFKLVYANFDNSYYTTTDKTLEVLINDGNNTTRVVLVQISAGNKSTTKNIIILPSPGYSSDYK